MTPYQTLLDLLVRLTLDPSGFSSEWMPGLQTEAALLLTQLGVPFGCHTNRVTSHYGLYLHTKPIIVWYYLPPDPAWPHQPSGYLMSTHQGPPPIPLPLTPDLLPLLYF